MRCELCGGSYHPAGTDDCNCKPCQNITSGRACANVEGHCTDHECDMCGDIGVDTEETINNRRACFKCEPQLFEEQHERVQKEERRNLPD